MKNLFKSLSAFQTEVPTIHKGTKGYGYSYASLPEIFTVINPLLKKHGLGFTQLLNSNEDGDWIKTIVYHIDSGENIESLTRIPKAALKGQNEYQAFGSGCTYYRRYSISCILRLVTDIDNDAADIKKQPNVSTKNNVEKKQSIDDDRFKGALDSIKAGNYSIEKLIETFDLTEEQIKEVEKLWLLDAQV